MAGNDDSNGNDVGVSIVNEERIRIENEILIRGARLDHHRTLLITYAAVAIALGGAVAGIAALFLSEDSAIQNWAMNLIFSLVGFAAGSLWPSTQLGKGDSN